MTPDAQWAERLSRKAITILLLGLLAVTVTERWRMPSRSTDRSLCVVSVGATALALAMANPFALAGGVAAACQCAPLLLDQFEGMTCP